MAHFVEGELEYGGDDEPCEGARYGDGYLRHVEVFMHHVADAIAAVDDPYQQECQCQSEYREAANQVEYFLHTAFFA